MSIFRMWGTGELKREYRHHNGKPVIWITRPLEPSAIPAIIELNNAHAYYPQTSEEFYQYLPLYTILACQHLHLPDEMITIKRFIDYVQDGFDELFKVKPELKEEKVYGEYTGQLGDVKISGELKR